MLLSGEGTLFNAMPAVQGWVCPTHTHTHRNAVFFTLRVVSCFRASLSATLPPLEGGIVTRGTVMMLPAVRRCPPQNRIGG